MTRDRVVIVALHDSLEWALSLLRGETLDAISIPYLAAAVERSLREGFDFKPHDPTDSVTKLITDGLNVRLSEVITAEVATDRASNITQSLVGLVTASFADELTVPSGIARTKREARAAG